MIPEINAGELDRRVTLLRPVTNAAGDEIESWEVVGQTNAAINPNAGLEPTGAGRTVSISMVPIIIRYRPDIDARWRVQDGTQTFEVLTKLDILQRHVKLQLNCEEVL